jgi:Tol biopolymer transport system component
MVMNLESGKLKKIADLGISTPEFSPDGNHIVFTTIPTLGVAGGNVWIMEDDGADPRPLLPPPPDNNRHY